MTFSGPDQDSVARPRPFSHPPSVATRPLTIVAFAVALLALHSVATVSALSTAYRETYTDDAVILEGKFDKSTFGGVSRKESWG